MGNKILFVCSLLILSGCASGPTSTITVEKPPVRYAPATTNAAPVWPTTNAVPSAVRVQ